MKNIFTPLWLYFVLFTSPVLFAEVTETELFKGFVNKMVFQHQFEAEKLNALFKAVEIKQNIIKTMQRPAEGLPWFKYRKIFLTDKRINGGLKFWQENAETLAQVESEYGVPADIIVAIIGVETRYGQHTGHHRVIDALSTLGFNYPKRSKFFLSELENFLILCREEKMDPLQPTGSYAGAMGIPQFMPSSFRSYAADFEKDGKRDIWNDKADAIASVANYFLKHHWKPGEQIVLPVVAKGDDYKKSLSKGLKPNLPWKQLQAQGITAQKVIHEDKLVRLLAFEQQKGQDLWVGLHNFYVITRYNHSPLYAMAVYQLAEAIRNKKLV